MYELRVWSPLATSVTARWSDTPFDLQDPRDAESVELEPDEHGWWHGVAGTIAGGDVFYGFSVDGGALRPSPRSRRQPRGVHGVSQAVDVDSFYWSDADWQGTPTRGASIYELHVGTFTEHGTLDAAAEKLDYLVNLGVTMVELMPLAAFNGNHGWGYDGVALFAVHEAYGGPQALQRFVDAAHRAGLGVCLDVVYNHLGPSGNYLAEFGPYFTDRHHTPWGQAVNLDDDHSSGMRSFILDNAAQWLQDFHIDALRLDAVHALVDDSPRHILQDLSDLAAAISSETRTPKGLIAESDLNDPIMVTPVQDGGFGMTAQWNDDVHHALHAASSGERQGYYQDFGSMHTLGHVLTNVFWHNGVWSPFRRDVWGAPVDRQSADPNAFVGYTLTHDQVGNRAAGERPSSYLSTEVLAARAAFALLRPGTAMVFMGEEWGATTPWCYFADHPEPDLAQAVSEGRKAEFMRHGWKESDIADPQSPDTFAASTLNWDTRSEDQEALWQWYRWLLEVRTQAQAQGDVTLADVHTWGNENEHLLAMLTPNVLVAAHFSDGDADIATTVTADSVRQEQGVGKVQFDAGTIAFNGPGVWVGTLKA